MLVQSQHNWRQIEAPYRLKYFTKSHISISKQISAFHQLSVIRNTVFHILEKYKTRTFHYQVNISFHQLSALKNTLCRILEKYITRTFQYQVNISFHQLSGLKNTVFPISEKFRIKKKYIIWSFPFLLFLSFMEMYFFLKFSSLFIKLLYSKVTLL